MRRAGAGLASDKEWSQRAPCFHPPHLSRALTSLEYMILGQDLSWFLAVWSPGKGETEIITENSAC